MNLERRNTINKALTYLPKEFLEKEINGKNGESVTTDEAEVWKRVLNYRLIKYQQPHLILETHKGNGVGTFLALLACSTSEIISCTHFETQIPQDVLFDFIDIDPFGFPYKALNLCKHLLKKNGIMVITSGEILTITRNLGTAITPTKYKGKQSWQFVEKDYIPYIENQTKLKCQFFYAYPTSVRIVLSNRSLPKILFDDCPKWMWWLKRYAEPNIKPLF